MNPCPDCQATREAPNHPLMCPTCLWCGARCIARILALRDVQTKKQLSARASSALRVWVEHGHSESMLRKLCADGCLIQPLSSLDPAPTLLTKKTRKKS